MNVHSQIGMFDSIGSFTFILLSFYLNLIRNFKITKMPMMLFMK